MILRPLIVVFMLGMTAVPSVRAADPLLSDGAFEMVTWTADLPNERWRDLCTLAADRVNCTMQKQYGDHTFATAIAGTLRGDDIVGRAHLRVTFRGPCSYVSEAGLSGTIHLLADGTLSSTWDSKGSTHSGMTGTCQGMPSSSPPGPPSHWSGTWRQLASVDLNALSPAPGAQVTLVTNDGRLVTIDLSQWQGSKLSVEQMALAKEFEL
ncbi:MAG: hypothetical protein PSV46_09060, partial [Reyranella sp.]|nr:hypothetical protein [Reyranella sp.]